MSQDTSATTPLSYLLEPKAPLIIRSGRPFDEQAGADEARFPPPSTMAGALRAAHVRSNSTLSFDGSDTADILKIAVKGPLPVKIKADNSKTILVPKPEDARYHYDEDGSIQLVRLVPTPLDDSAGWDLDDRLMPLIYESGTDKRYGKPAKGPAWWSLDHLLQWRQQDSKQEPLNYSDIVKEGWTPPRDDIRTHVAIDAKTYASEEGKLFQTSGLPMWQEKQAGDIFPEEHIALLGTIAGEISNTAVNLGGERRLAKVQCCEGLWPPVDEAQIENIFQQKQLSLTLLTPAIFEYGWLPCKKNNVGIYCYRPDFIKGLALELVAASVPRWQAHSGWDLANQRPKPSKKVVPAGAVYWFKLVAGDKDALKQLWLSNISSDPQDRKDGFGLALPHATSFDAIPTSGAK